MASDVPAAVRRGTLAVISAQAVTQVISLLVIAVLFRRIGPEPYGYLGMALPWILFLRIFVSLGLNVATVQRPELSDDELDALFWTQQLGGGLTLVIIAAGAPILAAIYKVPELAPIVLTLSATTLLVSLAAPHQALMERRLRITRLALLRLVANLTGGVTAIVAAYAGWGVWALVCQQYVELALIAAAAWALEPWRPRAPRRIGSYRELLSFGGYWTASSFVLGLGQYADKFLLASWVAASPAGLAAVGMYTQAFQLMLKPVYLVTTPLSQIMLPALSRAHTHPEWYQSFLQAFYRMVAIVLFPCGVGLAIIGRDVMSVLGGDRWSAAGLLLTLLAPAIVAQGFVNLLGTVFASVGRTDRLLQASAVVTFVLVIGNVIGIFIGSRCGPEDVGPAMGLACAYSLTLLAVVVPYTAFAWNIAGVSIRGLVTPLRGPLLATAVMGLVVAGLHSTLYEAMSSSLWRLVIAVLCGATVYVCLAFKELIWLRRQLLANSSLKASPTRGREEVR